MRTSQIIDLKKKGLGRDAIYQLAAGNYNLFGVAFFGHKGTTAEKAKLFKCWQRIEKAFS